MTVVSTSPIGDAQSASIAETQRCFRALLDAMAHPGRVVPLGFSLAAPPGVSPASWALCLTLLDRDTPAWLDRWAVHAGLAELLRFHRAAPVVWQPEVAQFALVGGGEDMPALERFAQGSDERPELSATLLIEVRELTNATGWRLTGPGIDGEARLFVQGLPRDFAVQWRRNHAAFPSGVDVVFACRGEIAALPRSTRLEA